MASAASRAGSSAAGSVTRLTPWLEPAATGFTTTGCVQRSCVTVARVTRCPGAVEMPTALATSLVAHLSIASAPGRIPEPTYAIPASSQSAASAPSSPRGPCTTGKATSQPRSTWAAPHRPIGRSPRSRQVPSRPIVIGTTSYAAGSSDAATDAAEARDTSCSQF
jgi:hypothetical protein